jgi:hypothetical protein
MALRITIFRAGTFEEQRTLHNKEALRVNNQPRRQRHRPAGDCGATCGLTAASPGTSAMGFELET